MYVPVMHVIIAMLLTARRVDTYTPSYSSTNIEGHLPGIYFEYVNRVHARIDYWTTTVTIDLDKIKLQHSYHDQIASLLTECPASRVDCEVQVTQSKRLQRKLDQVTDKLEDVEHLLPRDTKFYAHTSIPSPSLDSPRVLGRETRILRLYQEVDAYYDAAINEARITGKNSAVEFFRAVQTWTMALEDLLDVYSNTCEETIEIIQQALKGYVSHHLLDTVTLEKVINHANSRYPEARIPVMEFTIEEVRNLIATTVTRKDSLITIALSFPLYSTTYYLLYRMHPILIPQGGLTSAYIQPPKEYILILKGQHNHTFLSQEDLTHCKRTANSWFCLPPTVLRPASCEVQLLMDSQDHNLTICNVKTKQHTSAEWTYLPEGDEWIYSTPTVIQVSVLCQFGYADTFTIKGIGILKLTKGCTASTKDATLNPRNNARSSSYLYSSTITLNFTQLSLNISTQEPEPDRISDGNSKNIERMVLLLYFIWPLSILLSLCRAVALTHCFSKPRRTPFYQPVPNAPTISTPKLISVVRQTQTEPNQDSVATQTIEQPPEPNSKSPQPSESTYESPPPPQPIIFPLPIAYSTDTQPSLPTQVHKNKFTNTLPTISEIA